MWENIIRTIKTEHFDQEITLKTGHFRVPIKHISISKRGQVQTFFVIIVFYLNEDKKSFSIRQ